MWKPVSWRRGRTGAHWICLQQKRRIWRKPPAGDGWKPTGAYTASRNRRNRRMSPPDQKWRYCTVEKSRFFWNCRFFIKLSGKMVLEKYSMTDFTYPPCQGEGCKFGFVGLICFGVYSWMLYLRFGTRCYKWKLTCGFIEKTTIYLFCRFSTILVDFWKLAGEWLPAKWDEPQSKALRARISERQGIFLPAVPNFGQKLRGGAICPIISSDLPPD